jgi:hypothetical protein
MVTTRRAAAAERSGSSTPVNTPPAHQRKRSGMSTHKKKASTSSKLNPRTTSYEYVRFAFLWVSPKCLVVDMPVSDLLAQLALQEW